MDKYELEGVIGHEMSHIIDYDTRIETVGYTLMSLFNSVADWMYDFAISSLWFGDDDDDSDDDDNSIVGFILGIILMIFCYILYGLSYVAQMFLSRKREYLADAGSVDLTRKPKEILNALIDVEKDTDDNLDKTGASVSMMFFANPHRKESWIASLMDTHPPLDKWIARIKGMMGE